MSANSTTLAGFAAELAHAAGSGAAGIASSVTASGNIAAKTAAAAAPGPGLAAVLGLSRGTSSNRASTAVDPDQIPAIADHMAGDALDQGTRLLSGQS